tara:strand:- start:275 stop:478 length:204 start_codon:yes stop_codon:yes gene_type:complete
MEQIQQTEFDLSLSRVTQSIDLDDTVCVEDANIVVESSILVVEDGSILTIGEGKILITDLYDLLRFQ